MKLNFFDRKPEKAIGWSFSHHVIELLQGITLRV
jgi:hypothetical protein